MLQDIFQKNSVLNSIYELNKNNKISFLDVLIEINYNNNCFTTSTYKTPQITTLVPLTLKVNTPSNIKRAIINNLISHAKLISPTKNNIL